MDRVAFTRNTLRDFVSHLGFRVADDNVVVSNEESICHFPFGGETLTASRRSQDKPVWVFELLSVAEYHVVRKGVQAIVQGLPRLKKLLRDKGNENSGA